MRGTLRDAVSHLRVEFLADTSAWTPEQSNELFRIPVQELLSVEGASKGDLSDDRVHPLRRIVAVLSDLEAWHASRREREGALDARLERFGQADERAGCRLCNP